MKTLIIPDIHLKWHIVDRILSAEPNFDKCILLGDYFDDFHDNAFSNEKMAEWIKERIDDPRFVFLMGNHDISYAHGGCRGYLICPGFTHDKNRAINKVLYDHWHKFQYYYFHEGILFSHAGMSDIYFKGAKPDLESLTEWLANEVVYSKREAFEMGSGCPKLFGAGHDRGGNQDVGGILWCDHSYHIPLECIPQIYGHSPLRFPDYRLRNVKKSHTFYCGVNDSREILQDFHLDKPWSLGLDTHLKHYGVIENNVLYIRNVNRYDSPTNQEFDTIHTRQLK